MKIKKNDLSSLNPVVLASAFMLGEVACWFFHFSSVISFLSLTILLILAALGSIFFKRVRVHPMILIAIVFFSLGILSLKLFDRKVTRPGFLSEASVHAEVFGRVQNIGLLHANKFGFELVCDSLLIPEGKYTGIWHLKCTLQNPDTQKISKIYSAIQSGNYIGVSGSLSTGNRSRNPGEFDYAEYLNQQGFSGVLRYGPKDSLVILSTEKDILPFAGKAIRSAIAHKADLLMNAEAAGLVKGLLLGDRTGIDREVQKEFVNAGVAHVLAVSGLNVAFVGYLVVLLLGRFSMRTKYLCMLFTILAFWLIAGNSPPVNRAVIMGAMLVINVLLGRQVQPMSALFSTAFVSLVFAPSDLFTPSFQLSFAGVFALLYAYPVMQQYTGKIKKVWLRKGINILFLTFVAQLGTMPFTNYYFGKVSLTALLANALVVPGISFVIGGAIMSLIAGSIFMQLGALAGDGVNLLVRLIYWITNIAGGSYSWLVVSGFSVFAAIISLVFFIVYIEVVRRCRNTIAFVIITLLCVGVLQCININSQNGIFKKGKLSVLFVDVGQGDASLVKMPNGVTMLIDAGNASSRYDTGKEKLLPLLDYLGIQKIDHVIITHYDADHYKGIAALLNTGRIRNMHIPPADTKPDVDSLLRALSKACGAHCTSPHDRIWRIGGARIYFMANEAGCATGKTLNDKSIAVKIVYGSTSFFFTGDAQKVREENWLKFYSPLLHATILKVAHHGSKYGTCDAFLNAVSPQLAVISCGLKNVYSHPHPELLHRLQEHNIPVERTDLRGAVLLTSDGEKVAKELGGMNNE
ncbi:MAG: DNA internalization-related competence protein ComEC/Rec2 [Ignavibacteriales bacterium]|nr:DNA internalization-related competence protein ComEC/Rec2 [Ignavibacteriales bacterium]